jgi:hypothetical protein
MKNNRTDKEESRDEESRDEESRDEESRDAASDEVVFLASRHCNDSLTAEELVRLEEILDSTPVLRKPYLDYVRLNADLMWRYRTDERSTNDSSLADSNNQRWAVPRLLGGETIANVGDRGREGRFWWIASLAAAVLLMTALAAPWLRQKGGSDRGPESVAEQSMNPQDALTAEFVATLLNASTVVWSASGQAVDVGERMAPGEVWLESGEAECLFDSGAKLVLSGPARLRLRSSLSAHLESGTLVAHMPKSAIGFQLSTTAAEFTDQGTEFGVVAERDGPAEVHVFRGQVDVQSRREAATAELFDGQAMRIASANEEAESIEFSRARFGGLDLRVATPVRWASEDGGNDHFYELIVRRSPVTWHAAAAEAMRRYHHGLPGHLVSVTSSDEDEFLRRSILAESTTRGIWIGLTDVLRESKFQWITGETLEYTNWADFPEQQPDDYHEADWHGGEDYGMYTTFPGQQSWAWNDLSVDSVHENVAAYIVEYEPPIESLKNRTMALAPVQWNASDGGNGHHYQLVLSFESVDWETIRRRAEAMSLGDSTGQLTVLDTNGERDFVIDQVLRFSGISENLIGLSGGPETELKWITGQDFSGNDFGKPFLPAGEVYGLLFWDYKVGRWGIQTRSMDALPAGWFGYVVEYP